MLILARKEGERIIIRDEIEITVLKCRDGRVRLGFCCPPEVSINRAEVQERIDKARRALEAGEEAKVAPALTTES